MNMEISEKLIEDSQKIDAGIRKLQGKISDVIDRFTEKNADPKVVMQKYKDELATIRVELKEFLRQQREFDRTVQNAEKEISMMKNDVRKMMLQNEISIPQANANNEVQ